MYEINIPQPFHFVAIESDLNSVRLYSSYLCMLHYLVCSVY